MSDSKHDDQRRSRYLNDAEYHARVRAAATYLSDWDFSKGADMDWDFYIKSAMDLIEAIDKAIEL
jgi:hypothetical protein